MITAVIAEKPSVAKDIANVLNVRERHDGYLSGNGYLVTWAFGHLVQLAMPEAYGYAGFRRENLPILPQEFKYIPRQIREGKEYKPDPGVLKQLKVIKEVFDRSDRIVVATDAGREGEAIHRYIYNYLGCRKPCLRLWISSLTDRAIREGLDNLKPGSDYDNLYRAAEARAIADWEIGLNATQALSIAAGQGIYSLGRVQTPTLMMICSRYLENRDFTPQTYFRLKITAEKDGKSQTIRLDLGGKSTLLTTLDGNGALEAFSSDMAELSVADGTLEDDNMDTRVLKAVFGASTDKVQSLRFTAAGLSALPESDTLLFDLYNMDGDVGLTVYVSVSAKPVLIPVGAVTLKHGYQKVTLSDLGSLAWDTYGDVRYIAFHFGSKSDVARTVLIDNIVLRARGPNEGCGKNFLRIDAGASADAGGGVRVGGDGRNALSARGVSFAVQFRGIRGIRRGHAEELFREIFDKYRRQVREERRRLGKAGTLRRGLCRSVQPSRAGYVSRENRGGKRGFFQGGTGGVRSL